MKKTTPTKPETPPTPWQRRYFYFTAATTGAAILIVEILGAKMLAPFVGTSHFVWTAQIAVTLVALSAGYYLGGWWVDRSRKPGSLYLGILGAALYLCVVATQVERVAEACLQFKLALGSLLASAFLFFVPLVLLATTGPFLIRLLTASVQGVGGSVGRLTAISTLGSVAGTVLVGYVLIPLLPNSLTMVLTATALMVVAAVYFLIWGSRNGVKAAALALSAGLACGYAAETKDLAQSPKIEEIYRGNSNFGQLQVFQSRLNSRRVFLNDYLEQGGYDTETKQGLGAFSYMLHNLACAYTGSITSVLCIGLGIGTVPMQFAREGVNVDVVEINPAVAPLARRYFDFQPDKINLTLGDGRQFVNESRKQYDAIILDAFLGESPPSHLMTREAFAAMRGRLRTNGVLVINFFGRFEAGRDFGVASLQKTLAAVFPSVRLHCRIEPGKMVNVYFVASAAELAVQRPPTFDDVHPFCRKEVQEAFAGVTQANAQDGIVLTDDYNPIDYYEATSREEMRRKLALSMQSIVKEDR